MNLGGKVALVTGGGSGIGRAIALRFAREGADIAVSDIDLPSAEKTTAEVREIGRKAIAIKADVSQVADVDMMGDRTIKELGGVHILVNNAGIQDEKAPTIDSSVEHWDKVIAVLLRGTYLCCRRAGRWMTAHREGRVINIGSVVGARGQAPRPSYAPGKAAIIHLTACLALEWAQYNINVNCISPGHILTAMLERNQKLHPDDVERAKQRIPLRRFGITDDIANAALFLVSDQSSYITGINLIVDGGWSI